MALNVKLQKLKAETFSKVNFAFILFMIGSLINGATMTYMHNYGLFLAYDLLAYAYVTNSRRKDALNAMDACKA